MGAISYTYDGDGRRVTKSVGGMVTTFVYDAQGQLAAEYGPATDSGTSYLTADHLGSTRLVTDGNGAPKKCYDYFPFGEEIVAGMFGRSSCFPSGVYPSNPDVLAEKFTGKERDAETGMDFFLARYYSSPQGRFTSPDEFKGGIVDPFTGQDIETNTALPYADITDPQTLNKYAYVRNNPLRYTDPNGHCAEALTCTVELGTAGAEIGSVFGPAGTVVGAIIGGGIGAFVGYEIGKAIVNNLPGTPAQAPNINNGPILVQPYDVGTANDLKGNSTTGDQLDVHHVPQQQPASQTVAGYDPKTAPAIALPKGEHQAVPTDRGAATRSPRDQLAKDAKDLRNKTNTPNSKIKEVIKLNKHKYPEMNKPQQ